MTDTDKDKDQEKGDEVLRRLLKPPPDPKAGKGDGKPKKESSRDENPKA